MKQDSCTVEEDGAGPAPEKDGFLGVIAQAVLSFVLIGGSVGVVLLLGTGQRPETKASEEAGVSVVEVRPVQEHTGGIDFEVDGVVIPFREVDVPAEVAGQVSYKSDNCRMGRTVKQGEVLLRIDPTDFELEIRRLEQELAKAKANRKELAVEIEARHRQIKLAEEDLEIQKREVTRYESIEDPGAYSKSELDAARLSELKARDAVQTEHDQLELLQARKEGIAAAVELVAAQLDKAEVELSRTEIEAPIGGVVTQEVAEEGSYVQRGGTIVRIQDTSCMEIRCSLQMHEMHWILRSTSGDSDPKNPRDVYQIPETPATVSFEVGGSTYRWQGSLSYFDGGQVDKQTRMIPCRVYVREPLKVEVESASGQSPKNPAAFALMAGMFVKVAVHSQPDLPLVELPEAAIQPGNTVWTATPGKDSNTLSKTTVRIAHGLGDTVLAYAEDDGLKAGDLAVVSPLAVPVEGASVKILEAK